MIENSIEQLFNSIENSSEYKEYQEITGILSNNEEVTNLISGIKSLQKEATDLEYHNDEKYKEIDKKIEEKITILNNNPTYQEYLKKLKKFNSALKASSFLLEEYIDGNVSI